MSKAKRDKQGKFVKQSDADAARGDLGQVTFAPQGRDAINTNLKDDNNKRDQQVRDASGRVKPGVMAEQYPTGGLEPHDKRDRMMSLKRGLADNQGVTPFGKLTWSDEVGEYLLKKEEAVKYARFQEWFARHYDKMDDAAKEVARDLFPRFFTEREQKLRENTKLLYDLAALRLHGVRTPRDLALKYAADNGMIDLTNLTDILHPEAYAPKVDESFQAGVFNPDRYLMTQTVDNSATFRGSRKGVAQSAFPPARNQQIPFKNNTSVIKALGLV